MGQDYSKDRVDHIPYSEALDKAKRGWVIARDGWNGKNMFVFLAQAGSFEAKDLTTGKLDPFLVMRTAKGTYVPWLCSQTDALADDWIALTRQTMQRQLPQQQDYDRDRERKLLPAEEEAEWREVEK